MNDRALVNGAVAMAAGFLATSLSSFLAHFSILGDATEFVRGFFHGLAVVAFGVAIFLLVRARRARHG